jgi:hypothetical protein
MGVKHNSHKNNRAQGRKEKSASAKPEPERRFIAHGGVDAAADEAAADEAAADEAAADEARADGEVTANFAREV